MKNKFLMVILLIGVYLISTGASYGFLSAASKPGPEQPIISPEVTGEPKESKAKIALTGPKDRVCPINGQMFTREEEEIWSGRRPLLSMIENHADSRPQSGLSKADVVYEAVAEGGIARLLAVFYCGMAAYSQSGEYNIGPVRSTRTYFLDWASEYGDTPLYNHVGGAGLCHDPTVYTKAKALCQIEKYGWKNKESWSDLDQFSLGFKICRREPDRTGKTVDTEHSMYCGTEALWQVAGEKRGLTNINLNLKKNPSWDANFKSWQFKEDTPASSVEAASPEFEFWKNKDEYRVKWIYDSQANSYKRENGGVLAEDFYYQEPVIAKNVVVQITKETSGVDEHLHLLYQTTGTGKAFIFQDGKAVAGSWSKRDRTARTKFVDSVGKEIKFNRGPIWIEVIPNEKSLTY
jgi:hypothetical protein